MPPPGGSAPDLVLSDVMMPGLDGFGSARGVLRADPRAARSSRSCCCRREQARKPGSRGSTPEPTTISPSRSRPVSCWPAIGANLAMARIRRESLVALQGLNETLEARVAERTQERDRIWRLSRELMLVAQADSTALAVNPAWTATLGWAEGDLVGRKTSSISSILMMGPRLRVSSRKVAHGARATSNFDLQVAPSRWHLSMDRMDRGTARGCRIYAVGRDVPPRAGRPRNACGRRRRWRQSVS